MECHEFRVQVFTYMDDELGVTERLEVTEHIQRCPPCAGALAYEIRIREVVARRCCETAPDTMRDRVRAALGLGDAQ